MGNGCAREPGLARRCGDGAAGYTSLKDSLAALRAIDMRIGIFGGTFDPVHLGHLIIADQAREQARLDQVWFVPSARPPHKLDKSMSPFDRRAEMLQLAIAGQTNFRVELIEKDR